MRRTPKKAFTLIETITVLTIVAVLLGLVLTGTFKAIEQAKIEKARVDMKALRAALDMFEADIGHYPIHTDALTGNDFKSWLSDGEYWDGGFQDYENWYGPYMVFFAEDLNDGNHYKDPWGTNYRYHSPDGTSYNLWSYGPDKTNNSGNGDTIDEKNTDDISG